MYPQQAPSLLAAGGSANALTISVPNITSMVNLNLVVLTIATGSPNTGATTINVNSFGAKTVLKPSPSGLTALTGGEFLAGVPVQVYWLNTVFVLVGPIPLPGFVPVVISPGSVAFTTPGSHSFNVPAHVTGGVFAIVTGGGGGRGIPYAVQNINPDSYNYQDGGAGGAGGTTMGWVACSAGDVLSITVGAAGTNGGDVFSGNNPATNGTLSSIGVILAGYGGYCGSGNSGGSGGLASGGALSMNGGYGGSGMIGFFSGQVQPITFRCVAGGASYWGGSNAPGAGACGGPWGVTSPNSQLDAGNGAVFLSWIGGGT